MITAAAWLAYGYLRLVYATTRWHHRHKEIPLNLMHQNQGFVAVFWHNRLAVMIHAWRQLGVPMERVHILISNSRDGLLIATVMRLMGASVISGSTNRDGIAALREAVKILKSGGIVAITPDGPRGPNMVASPGVLTMAQLAKVPVVPVSGWIQRHIALRSWDRMMIPFPLSHGRYAWGNPLMSETLTLEEVAAQTTMTQNIVSL